MVVGAVMLAFNGSKLKDAIDRDAFKIVLEMDYDDLVDGEALDLQGLWNMLDQQKGFDPALAEPIMCALKVWEPRFGHEVRLPHHLAGLDERELALKSATISAPSAKLQSLFTTAPADLLTPRTKRASMHVGQARARRDSMGMIAAVSTQRAVATRLTWRERREVGIVAAVIAVAAAGFAGWQLMNGGKDGDWTGFDLAQHTRMPVQSPERLGKQVTATLVDDAWLSAPVEQRTQQMESALRSMYADEIDVYYVKDSNGRVRAIAQWWGNPREIRVTFK